MGVGPRTGAREVLFRGGNSMGGSVSGAAGGRISCALSPIIETASAAVRARLKSRQHVGHRHSSMMVPSFCFVRVSRQPNCALMSV
jgi:hypothetical protein